MAEMEVLLGDDIDLLGPEGFVKSKDLKTHEAVIVYFTATWCKPSKEFTGKKLTSWYQRVKANGRPVEIVAVIEGDNQREFEEYYYSMPCLVVPFDGKDREYLKNKFRVDEYPAMVVGDPKTGKWFSIDCRKALDMDPNGDKLPWTEFRQKSKYYLEPVQHTDPMPGPIWKDRLFISYFAEGYLENVETTGGDKQPCGDVAALLQVHGYICQKILTLRPEWLTLCTAEDCKAIHRCNGMLKAATELSRRMAQIQRPEQLSFFLQFFVDKKLRPMKPGDMMVFPGGWQDPTSGHCIMHTIEREKKNKSFTFTVHNTGKGIDHHLSTPSKPPGLKYAASAVFHDVPESKILDYGFWYMFLKCHCTVSDNHRKEVLYDILFPHLLGLPFAKALARELKTHPETKGVGFFPAQRAETCYYSSIQRVYDYLLAHHGLDDAKIKQFRFAFTRALVSMALVDLQIEDRIVPSDARLLQIATKSLARQAAEEGSQARLKGANMAEILAKIEQVNLLSNQLTLHSLHRSIPSLLPKNIARWQPHMDFRAFPRSLDVVRRFAGKKSEAEENELIDMNELGDTFVNTPQKVIIALRTCLNLCKKLFGKNAVVEEEEDSDDDDSDAEPEAKVEKKKSKSSRLASGSYFHVCSLIQQLFTQVIPMPRRPAEVKLLSECVWLSMDVTRKEYLQIVNDIHLLARYYTAASRSVQSNRHFKGANIVTMTCIMACLDAMVRVFSKDEQSSCAIVLNGLQHLLPGGKRQRGANEVKLAKNKKEFDKLMDAAIKEDQLAVVDFYASWCGPCKYLEPLYIQMAKDFKDKPVVFIKLDSANLPDMNQQYGVTAYPTLLYFYRKKDKEVARVVGANEKKIEGKVKKWIEKIEKGTFKEQPLELPTDADPKKVTDMMSKFGVDKKGIIWALRVKKNNTAAAMDLYYGTSDKERERKANALEKERTAIEIENKKILQRVEKRNQKIEKKQEKQRKKEEKKKKRFDCKAATKMRRHPYYLSLQDGDGQWLKDITNTCVLTEPTLAVARGNALRYFIGQQGEKHSKGVFNFRKCLNCTTFITNTGPSTEFMKSICEFQGHELQPSDEKNPMDDSWSVLQQVVFYFTHPKSPLTKEMPELFALRDVSLLFRIICTETYHRNHVDLKRWTIPDTQAYWGVRKGGSGPNQVDLTCGCFRLKSVCLEVKRRVSPADPSQNGKWVKAHAHGGVNEDDVLHMPSLPTFDNSLSQEDSEYLLSALTVPYLRIPLVLQFFTQKDRVSSLLHVQLQNLLESVLFEPMHWIPDGGSPVNQVPVDSGLRHEQIGCEHGLLINELTRAPNTVILPLVNLAEDALELNTGKYTSSSSTIILFLIRILSTVHNYIMFLLERESEGLGMKRNLSQEVIDSLKGGSVSIEKTLGKTRPVLIQWENQAQEANDLRYSCIMHAHLVMLFRGMSRRKICEDNVKRMLSHLVFLQTWHSPGLGQGSQRPQKDKKLDPTAEINQKLSAEEIDQKISIRRQGGEEKLKQDMETPLLVPEHTYFDMHHMHLKSLIDWFSYAKPKQRDRVMQSILRMSTRNDHLVYKGWLPRLEEPIGVFVLDDEKIEVNIQTGELHFKSSRIEPVPNDIARNEDFSTIFGKEPQHSATVATYDHMHWVRIVGKDYNIRWWDKPELNVLNPLINMPEFIGARQPRGFKWYNKEYTRRFPDQITQSERWIREIMVPVLFSKYGNKFEKVPFIKDRMCFLPSTPADEKAVSTSILAIEQGVGYRVFRVFKAHKLCLHYLLHEHGRQMYPTLTYASNAKFAYSSLQPDFEDKGSPSHPLLRHEAGNLKGALRYQDSVMISRSVGKEGSQETFIPQRLLEGTLPAVLTENFYFWQLDDGHLVGYPRELGHNIFNYKVRVRLVLTRGEVSAAVTRSPLTHEEIVYASTAVSVKSFFDVKIKLENDDPMMKEIKKLKVDKIKKQGFSEFVAKQVLEQFKYVLPLVQSWLANPKNMKELKAMEAKHARNMTPDMRPRSPSSSTPKKRPRYLRSKSQKKSDMLILFDLLSAAKKSALGKLVKVLCRVETIGHILIWTRKRAEDDDELQSLQEDLQLISYIELPRLKLKFVPRGEGKEFKGNEEIKFYSEDHSDLFISNYRNRRLDDLVQQIPHALIMENSSRELFVLVPNCPVKRPNILMCPFSTELKLDLNDANWHSNMNSRFYLYPVHGSMTFFNTPTLASAMYLILLRMQLRQYEAAFNVVQSCEADCKLTKDEAFVFQQLVELANDHHPDAHAVKLKFSLVVMHCGTSIEELWELQQEYQGYIRKLDLVSAKCKLSIEEEMLLLNHIKNCHTFEKDDKPHNQLEAASGELDTELANRCAYLRGLLKLRGMSGESKQKGWDVTGERGFQYGETTMWDKVEEKIDEFYMCLERRTWKAHCHYHLEDGKDIKASDAVEVCNLLWKDQVTGRIEGLGFYFVAEMLMGRVKIKLANPNHDDAKTLGKLFAKVMLMKATGWGARIKSLRLGNSHDNDSWYPIIILSLLEHWTESKKKPTLPELKVPEEYDGNFPTFVGDYQDQITDFGRYLADVLQALTPIKNGLERKKKRETLGAYSLSAVLPKSPSIPLLLEDSGDSPEIPPRVEDFGCQTRSLEPYDIKDSDHNDASSESNNLTFKLTAEDLKWFRTTPLGPINLEKYVGKIKKGKSGKISGDLPFNLEKHAKSKVAMDMLGRLKEDMTVYADMENNSDIPLLLSLTDEDIKPLKAKVMNGKKWGAKTIDACNQLIALSSSLTTLRNHDEIEVEKLAYLLISRANSVPLTHNRNVLISVIAPESEESIYRHDADGDETVHWGAEISRVTAMSALRRAAAAEGRKGPPEAIIKMFNKEAKNYLYLLKRQAGEESWVDLEFLSAVILSRDAEGELRRLNPFLSKADVAEIIQLTLTFMLRVNRIRLIDRSRAITQNIRKSLTTTYAPGNVMVSLERRMELATILSRRAAQLASTLTSERYCMGHKVARKAKKSEFDPRFVIFEYLFNILLRKKQVEILNDFLFGEITETKTVGSANSGHSKSLVRQMIMGAGKSTVVGPMLTLILADGMSLVSLVVPGALLEMSRSVMRSRFTHVISKRVHTLEFDRSCEWVSEIKKIFTKLSDARKTKGVVVTTPACIKSLMLKHIELLDHMMASPPHLTKIGEKRLKVRSIMADEIAKVITLWSDKGVLILDEVDMLLHPLRSELNFPIGAKTPLDLSPSRWQLPMHLLDAIFYSRTGKVSTPTGLGGEGQEVVSLAASDHAQRVLQNVKRVMEQGIRSKGLQTSPHLILLDQTWYKAYLMPALAPWLLIWLRIKHFIQLTLNNSHALAYLMGGPQGETGYQNNCKTIGLPVPKRIEQTHTREQKKILNLSAEWLQSYMPHILTKIDRVSYGLLLEEDMENFPENMPASRKLMGVPFVGKDVPSISSEFAQPDVLIGLTILAYRYEGLRLSDVIELVKELQDALRNEIGPPNDRPSAKVFQRYIRLGKEQADQKWRKDQVRSHMSREKRRRHSSDDKENRDLMQVRKEYVEKMVTDEHTPVFRVNPLPIFQLSDTYQLQNLYALVKGVPDLIHHYLNQIVFPKTLQHQETKLSASGQELGGAILFPRRLGFSGTPSDLLPIELDKCKYEKGSEGRILHTLVSKKVVSYELIEGASERKEELKTSESKDSVGLGWTVEGLLTKIATAKPPYHALIDTGALVTGLTNDQVARFLMEKGLSKCMDACVFLDRQDRRMALLKTGKIIPLKQCGVELSKRFSFYDQVHTTGMDIKQTLNATAVVTLGKDMTHRDFSQGCYRMRGIGIGQTIHLYIIPEVLRLIRKEVGDSGSLQKDVNAWLLVNSMRSEKLQFMQLCMQNAANVFRKKCHKHLLNSTLPPKGKITSNRHWRFQDDPRAIETIRVRQALQIFREKIDFSVSDRAVVDSRSFKEILEELIQNSKSLLEGDVKALKVLEDVTKVATVAGTQAVGNEYKKKELSQEMVQEAEQEAQKQKEKQVEQEQQVQVRFSRDDEHHIQWPTTALTQPPSVQLYKTSKVSSFFDSKETRRQKSADMYNIEVTDSRLLSERHPFYHFDHFSLRGRGKCDLKVPRSQLLSHNYFRPEWASTGHRRLKNVVLILEWQRKKERSSRTKSFITRLLSRDMTPMLKRKSLDIPPDIHEEKTKNEEDDEGILGEMNEKLIQRMFELLDFKKMGYLDGEQLTILARLLGEGTSPDAECRIHDLMPEVEEGHKVDFQDFRNLIVEWSRGDSEETKQNDDRSFVCVSLTEAETIRRLMHARHPVLEDAKLGVSIGLRMMPYGQLLDASPGFDIEWSKGSADMQTAMACFRFLNCDFFFGDTEVLMLMRGLRMTDTKKRQAFFENAIRCRRRVRQAWKDTPLSKIFTFSDHFQVLANRAILLLIRHKLREKKVALHRSFDKFDSVSDGRLHMTELKYALGKAFLNVGLTDNEISRLIQHCDKDSDGQLSRYEFLEALYFGQSEEEIKILNSDLSDKVSPLELPDHLKEEYAREEKAHKERLAAMAAMEEKERKSLENKRLRRRIQPVFYCIDKKNNGFIGYSDIQRVLVKYTKEQFDRLLLTIGKKDKTTLSLNDFCEHGLSIAQRVRKVARCEGKDTKNAIPPGKWECPKCTLINDDSNDVCTLCEQSEKPDKLEEERKAEEEEEIEEKVGLMDFDPKDWACGRQNCYTIVPSTLRRCPRCNSERQTDRRDSMNDSSNLWVCSTCGKFNKKIEDNCTICQGERPKNTQKAKEMEACAPPRYAKELAQIRVIMGPEMDESKIIKMLHAHEGSVQKVLGSGILWQ
ncbi:hypothetical protein AAMO2058_000295800 [Amorphochlora amoebiformis]